MIIDNIKMKKFDKLYSSILTEARGINLVVVDIQPAYENYFSFLPKFIEFLNENDFARVLYLFNGPELGYESESELMYWLVENGLDEEKLNDITFFDKGYGFFRNWMDDIDEDDIIKVGQYMIRNNVDDSRDIDKEDYDEMNLSELSDNIDSINIPEVVDKLKKLNKPLLCGGGKDECLREIELLFRMINKKYKTYKKFIY